MEKYFITSDIHSYFDELIQALDDAGFSVYNPDHFLCACGDIFDRGPKSKEVLQFLQQLGDRFIYVRGNHEDLLFDCVRDIVEGKTISPHHFSNGTIKTVEQLCGLNEDTLWHPRRSDSLNQLVRTQMEPILEWIDTKSINYVEIGDCILVHGWVPTTGESIDFMGNWIHPEAIPIEKWKGCGEYTWGQARWENGMDMWKKGARIPGKTIICGHWHSSWGHSHLHQDRKEFPHKNRKDWQRSFEPFTDDGIIAVDSCCAYSGFLNCVVLEVEE